MCLLASCWGTGSADMGVLEPERGLVVAGDVFSTGTPCLKLPRASMALLASPGTGVRFCPCCHPPGWRGQLSECTPTNLGWFAGGGQGATSLALCSEEGDPMGTGWEDSAGPAMRGGFPCSRVVLKVGAEDEVVVEKPIEG